MLYAAFGYMTREGSAAYHRAIRLSEELGDPEAPVRALDGLFGTHFNSGQFSDAIGVSDRLIELGEGRNDVKALVLGLQFKGMSLFSRGQLTSARLYLERALEHKAQADEVGSDFARWLKSISHGLCIFSGTTKRRSICFGKRKPLSASSPVPAGRLARRWMYPVRVS